MSTRSNICKKLPDGTIKHIYCHWDGHPSHNGQTLKEHYTDEAKVDALLELGDLSVLGPEIGEKQDFNDRSTHNENWCLAYGRDRGETNIEAGIARNIHDIPHQEFTYIFDDGVWKCYIGEHELKF